FRRIGAPALDSFGDWHLNLIWTSDVECWNLPASLLPQLLLQFIKRQRIYHVLLGQSCFARHTGAKPQISRLLETMGITIDDTFDSFASGIRPKPPVHIEAIGAGVQLDPRARLGAGIDDGAMVHLVR